MLLTFSRNTLRARFSAGQSGQVEGFVTVVPPGGRGGTPLYGLYRYVPRDRAWFLEVLDP